MTFQDTSSHSICSSRLYLRPSQSAGVGVGGEDIQLVEGENYSSMEEDSTWAAAEIDSSKVWVVVGTSMEVVESNSSKVDAVQEMVVVETCNSMEAWTLVMVEVETYSSMGVWASVMVVVVTCSSREALALEMEVEETYNSMEALASVMVVEETCSSREALALEMEEEEEICNNMEA